MKVPVFLVYINETEKKYSNGTFYQSCAEFAQNSVIYCLCAVTGGNGLENKFLLLKWEGKSPEQTRKQQVAREQPSGVDGNQAHKTLDFDPAAQYNRVAAAVKLLLVVVVVVGGFGGRGGGVQLMFQLIKHDKKTDAKCTE